MTTAPHADPRTAQLFQLCTKVFARRPLIVVSNRGPLEYHILPDAQLQARRGSGAVVTALSKLVHNFEFTWVASAMGEGDRKAAEQAGAAAIKSPIPGQRVKVRFVVTPRRVYHKFYNILCNPLLWFLQHYMWSSPYTPNVDSAVRDAWETGYVPVNRAFADATLEEARALGTPPLIMLHDYHLYLAAAMLREALPDAILHHLVHIPWPSGRFWQLLPADMRTAICRSLCACNIVAFQSAWDVHNFLESCRWFVPGAKVDFAAETIEVAGRRTLVRSYPLSIDVDEVRRIATSPRAREYEPRLRAIAAAKTIVRVDRAEPSKNIVRGFRAYQMLLERHPELRGQVKFLAFLVPSRTHIKQYERYLEEIDQLVKNINATFGNEGWQPIHTFYENNYTQAIAALRLYDVLLVNPVADGMNLVSKEGPVVNIRNGVLVLSESAGACEQLKEGALVVAPADLDGTAQTLYDALTMSEEERARRTSILVEAVSKENVTHWLLTQLQELEGLL